MSDAPRTKEAYFRHPVLDRDTGRAAVLLEVPEQLERELAALKDQIARSRLTEHDEHVFENGTLRPTGRKLFGHPDVAEAESKATKAMQLAANKARELAAASEHINRRIKLQLDAEAECVRLETELAAVTAQRDELAKALEEFVECVEQYDEEDLLSLDSDPHPPSCLSVQAEAARAILASLSLRQCPSDNPAGSVQQNAPASPATTNTP